MKHNISALIVGHRTIIKVLSALIGLLCAAVLLRFFFQILSENEYFADLHAYGTRTAADGSFFSALSIWTEAEARYVQSYIWYVIPASLLLALVGSLLPRGFWRGLLDEFEKMPRWAITAGLALLIMGEIFTISVLVLHQTPLTDDELAYLFQSEIILKGRLTLDSPPPVQRPHFDNVFVVNNGSWFTQYPFGHPAFLALGTALEFPQLIPILFASLTLICCYLIASIVFDRFTAFLSSLLLCFSPFFIFTSSTLLSHSSTCFLTSLSLLFLVLATERKQTLMLLWSGLAIGSLVHFRPHLAALIGGPALVVLLLKYAERGVRTWKERQRRWLRNWIKPISLWGAGLLLPVAGYFFINYIVNDNPLITNYDAYWKRYYERKDFDNTTVLGFGIYPWGIKHTPELGWRNTWLNAVRLAFWLFGNPLVLVFTCFAVGDRSSRLWSFVFLSLPILFLLFHFFYFWPGINDTGPVFYSEVISVLVLATARGASLVRRWPPLREKSFSFVLVPLVLGFCCFVPTQCAVLNRLQIAISAPYRALDEWSKLHATSKKLLVFMASQIQPAGNVTGWVMSRPNPHPDLSDRNLYVLDLGIERNQKLARHYPDRTPVVLKMRSDRSISIKKLFSETISTQE